jgi:hypothetical protein
MRFSRCVALLACVFVMVICSCEEHRVGEMPEAQKEHVDLAKPGEEKASVREESKSSPAMKTSPTPAEFFPSATPH